jgi:hypothetical protein
LHEIVLNELVLGSCNADRIEIDSKYGPAFGPLVISVDVTQL